MNRKNYFDKTTISIGLPVYNSESNICTAIQSILDQDFIDFELIISDNCSTDNTWNIIQRFANKDDRIKIFRQKKNIGMVNNFRFVLNMSHAKHFCFMADDDYYSKNYLSELYKTIRSNKNVALACSKIVNVYQSPYKMIETPCSTSFNEFKDLKKILYLVNHHYMSWFYGMFLTKEIKYAMNTIYKGNEIDGSDRLIMYYFIFNKNICANSNAIFYKMNQWKKNRRKAFKDRYYSLAINFFIKAMKILFASEMKDSFKLIVCLKFTIYLIKLLKPKH